MTVGSRDEELLRRAQLAHKEKSISKAAQLYSRLLRGQPGHPIALNNLAAIFIERGQLGKAKELLKRALKSHPQYSDAAANMAACQGQLERWEECEAWSKRAIADQPTNSAPWLWLARAHKARAETKEAMSTLERATKIGALERSDEIRIEMAELLFTQGRRAASIRLLIGHYPLSSRKNLVMQEILAIATKCRKEQVFYRFIESIAGGSGGDPEIRYWHARKQLSAGEEADAILQLMHVAEQEPTHAPAWMELGIILRKQKNYPKAIACLRRSVDESKNNPKTWEHLVTCLIEAKYYKEAMRESAFARKLFPANLEITQTHCHALVDGNKARLALNIIRHTLAACGQDSKPGLLNCEGLALIRLQEYREAARKIYKAIKLTRTDSALWNNIGMAYGLMGRNRYEVFCYRRAIECNPDDPGSHVNIAMALLAKHNFDLGLEEYEWRLRKGRNSLNTIVEGRPAEKGETPDEVLIISEQGLGDTLHFCRYLHDLRHLLPSATLTLACPSKLKGLLSRSIGCVDKVVSCDKKTLMPTAGKYLALMSLPYFCNIDPRRSKAPYAYLSIEDTKKTEGLKAVRQGISPDRLVVGLNWKGNQETERTNLRGRSMKLEDMAILALDLPDAVFVSLQKGEGSEELETCSFRDRFIPNQDIISNIWSFTETSAHVLACDHIVTTDTSMAHLAGGLGQKTHVVLTAHPEWRWRADMSKSSWYEQTWLSRQTSNGDWTAPLLEVIKRIKAHAALSRLANHRTMH